MKAKKPIMKKKPTRSTNRSVTGVPLQFEQPQLAPPGKLYSSGPIPWRLLAYLLKIAPEVSKVREVRKRLMDGPRVQVEQKILDRMLLYAVRQGLRDVRIPRRHPRRKRANPTRC